MTKEMVKRFEAWFVNVYGEEPVTNSKAQMCGWHNTDRVSSWEMWNRWKTVKSLALAAWVACLAAVEEAGNKEK